jgi:hypothetical protein
MQQQQHAPPETRARPDLRSSTGCRPLGVLHDHGCYAVLRCPKAVLWKSPLVRAGGEVRKETLF